MIVFETGATSTGRYGVPDDFTSVFFGQRGQVLVGKGHVRCEPALIVEHRSRSLRCRVLLILPFAGRTFAGGTCDKVCRAVTDKLISCKRLEIMKWVVRER